MRHLWMWMVLTTTLARRLRRRDEKIVGGALVKDTSDVPYVVSILVPQGPGGPKPFCGGSLLTMVYVVTACHCTADVPESPGPAKPLAAWAITLYLFVAGSARMGKQYDKTAQVRKPKKLMYHPQCAYFNDLIYDLGLAEMQQPFGLSPYVQPVKTLSMDPETFEQEVQKLLSKKPYCQMSGWGDQRRGANEVVKPSDRLKTVRMYVIPEAECLQVYCKKVPGLYDGYSFSKNKQICATSLNKVESDCRGDSGSSYVCDGYIVAVASYGLECGTADPSVYQGLQPLLDWYRSIVTPTHNVTPGGPVTPSPDPPERSTDENISSDSQTADHPEDYDLSTAQYESIERPDVTKVPATTVTRYIIKKSGERMVSPPQSGTEPNINGFFKNDFSIVTFIALIVHA